jgi:hypothetical protein
MVFPVPNGLFTRSYSGIFNESCLFPGFDVILLIISHYHRHSGNTNAFTIISLFNKICGQFWGPAPTSPLTND